MFVILFVAVAAVVCVAVWAHAASAASVYGTTQMALSDGSTATTWGSDPTGDAAVELTRLGREGARWARRGVLDAYLWAALLLVVGVWFAFRSSNE